jgi:hypothetical protein
MTSRDFCFWLQGFFEMGAHPADISQPQAEVIRRHLALVFAHEIDPAMGGAKHQNSLNVLHKPAPNHKLTDHPGSPGPIGGSIGGVLYRC